LAAIESLSSVVVEKLLQLENIHVAKKLVLYQSLDTGALNLCEKTLGVEVTARQLSYKQRTRLEAASAVEKRRFFLESVGSEPMAIASRIQLSRCRSLPQDLLYLLSRDRVPTVRAACGNLKGPGAKKAV